MIEFRKPEDIRHVKFARLLNVATSTSVWGELQDEKVFSEFYLQSKRFEII